MNRDEIVDIGLRAANYCRMAKFAIQDENMKEAVNYFEMAADEYKTLAELHSSLADRLAFRLMERQCLNYTYINAKDEPLRWESNQKRIRDISDEVLLLEAEGSVQ